MAKNVPPSWQQPRDAKVPLETNVRRACLDLYICNKLDGLAWSSAVYVRLTFNHCKIPAAAAAITDPVAAGHGGRRRSWSSDVGHDKVSSEYLRRGIDPGVGSISARAEFRQAASEVLACLRPWDWRHR